MSGYYQKAIDMYNELKGRYSLFKKGDNPYIEQFKNANNFNSEVIMAGMGTNLHRVSEILGYV